MKPYTYILVEFFTIVVCFIFSFDRRIQFHKHFLSFFKASLIVAIPFLIWDIWFTHMGVWWFDFDYTLGIDILGLPLEEWLFFVCIPFSCVFTFFALEKFFQFRGFEKYNGIVAYITIIVCLAVSIVFYDRAYPFLTATASLLWMTYLHFIKKVDWIAKASMVFLILMFGFLPVNGILTGSFIDSPIVNYNPSEILNIRIFTIPIEDTVYGYTEFTLIWYFFQYFRKRSNQKLA